MSVWLSGKSSKTLLMNVNSHWIYPIEENIDSQIILQIVYQVRLIKVVLDNKATLNGTVLYYLFTVAREVYSLTL